ncbi:MAG: hypothetical protein AB2687_20785, partial [Candidatus Thiodiazotropha taylori]
RRAVVDRLSSMSRPFSSPIKQKSILKRTPVQSSPYDRRMGSIVNDPIVRESTSLPSDKSFSNCLARYLRSEDSQLAACWRFFEQFLFASRALIKGILEALYITD